MADLAAGLADRGSRFGAALWRRRPLAALAEMRAAEGDRRILWLPVFFATGIALYFTPTFGRRGGSASRNDCSRSSPLHSAAGRPCAIPRS